MRNTLQARHRTLAALLIGGAWLCMTFANCQRPSTVQADELTLSLDTNHLIDLANRFLAETPVTITAFPAPNSAGGLHDYYSEGRYWWPDPTNPDGPYIRKDGESNPANFNDHKRALGHFSEVVATLTSAYTLRQDQRYIETILAHLTAWFVNPDTRMHPSLHYGQAIKGITTGRGIGIIDTLCLIRVARSILLLAEAGLIPEATLTQVRQWFSEYGDWLTTHSHGIDERDNNNNHSTWWGAQVAAYARVAERVDLLQVSQQQFKTQLDIQ